MGGEFPVDRDTVEVALRKLEGDNWIIIVSQRDEVDEPQMVLYEHELHPGDIAHLEVGDRGIVDVFKQKDREGTRLIHLTLK